MSRTRVEKDHRMTHPLSTEPHLYQDSLARNLPVTALTYPNIRYITKYGYIDSTMSSDMHSVRSMLLRHEFDSQLTPEHRGSQIARVELFRGYTPDYRQGMVVFNEQGEALFHAVNAVLGYKASSASLAREVLREIGISNELFHEVNSQAALGAYSVVISRENTEMVGDVQFASRTKCANDWVYWFVKN